MSSFMSRYAANNPSVTDALSISSPLTILSGISLAAMLWTLFVAFKLPKAAAPQSTPAPAKPSAD